MPIFYNSADVRADVVLSPKTWACAMSMLSALFSETQLRFLLHVAARLVVNVRVNAKGNPASSGKVSRYA